MAVDAPSGARTDELFDADQAPRPGVAPVVSDAHLGGLADALPGRARFGTSSWNFPGWNGLVWDGDYDEKRLSRDGLAAYAQHPLFGTVSLDRAFYQPLSVAQYADYAAQVPRDFRFVVKAPARISDALVRGTGGRATAANPDFLDARIARDIFVEPACRGLGERLGVLVWQLSPLPRDLLGDMAGLVARLDRMLATAAEIVAGQPGVVIAVEVRNPEWLGRTFVATLKAHGATYCLGLHPRMPPIAEQLPILRALWPGPFVARWNLNMRHGAYGYEKARADYAPFDTLIDPDPATRDALARVIAGTTGAGQPAFVTINNKAEGSAPCSVRALAEAVIAARRPPTGDPRA
ncbi:DUF72 domain-containing protein [Salinisphaera sp. Q1T1-3]|uniref:DUF72 domain-containing protein n=1 Tax=Salinisphaera sp. Q1T1-3 TaxID=2321229 RepID=UPI000E73DC62|nr:DUF72 domain-containing protein [Salinisphaera sp. Q1T1-3]RJS92403.1 DUF72 domain-containing protein [Salinisphaera sp. Q1T1-3]